MRRDNVAEDRFTFACRINAHSRAGNLEAARAVLREANRCGFPSNNAMLDPVVRCMLEPRFDELGRAAMNHADRVRGVLRWLDSHLSAGRSEESLNDRTLNTLLRGCKRWAPEVASQVLPRFEGTYSVVTRALAAEIACMHGLDAPRAEAILRGGTHEEGHRRADRRAVTRRGSAPASGYEEGSAPASGYEEGSAPASGYEEGERTGEREEGSAPASGAHHLLAADTQLLHDIATAYALRGDLSSASDYLRSASASMAKANVVAEEASASVPGAQGVEAAVSHAGRGRRRRRAMERRGWPQRLLEAQHSLLRAYLAEGKVAADWTAQWTARAGQRTARL